jgi:hypothetical protein
LIVISEFTIKVLKSRMLMIKIVINQVVKMAFFTLGLAERKVRLEKPQ